MPISKGEPWGTVGEAPVGVQMVRSNLELWTLVNDHRSAGTPLPVVGLLGGDLMRAVGGTGDEARFTGDVAMLPVDLVRAESEGIAAWFVAHLVARRSWWSGPLVAVMNAEHHGTWDIAPRAHPNDGRVDVVAVAATMSRRDRLRARGRLERGAHVPHPSIEIRQRAVHEFSFDRPTRVWLDGRRWTTTRSVVVTVEPDALIVCV
jgi:YegS C-terminal NAD kinase beta sandwich-like domain